MPASTPQVGFRAAGASAVSARSDRFKFWTPLYGLFFAAWIVGCLALTPDFLGLVRQNWIYVPIGVAGGFVGNISAVGGGIVFIPCVVFLFHVAPVTALKIALGTQAFGMTSGALGWTRRNAVPSRALKVALPGLLIGSSISSLIIHPSALIVKALFGPVSIFVGLLTLFITLRYRPAGGAIEPPRRALGPLFVTSLIGGMITGWVAIGEGELVAALLMLVYGVDAYTCIGFGVLLLAVNSIYLAVLHQFLLGGLPWPILEFTVFGAVFGARLAPWVSRFVAPHVLKLLFAAIAISDGSLFIFQYFHMRALH